MYGRDSLSGLYTPEILWKFGSGLAAHFSTFTLLNKMNMDNWTSCVFEARAKKDNILKKSQMIKLPGVELQKDQGVQRKLGKNLYIHKRASCSQNSKRVAARSKG